MSSKTKIVVLRMKEIIYTAIFIGLGILLILLLLFMFRPKKEEAAASNAEVSYIPGIYSATLTLGSEEINIEVAVDTDRINSITMVPLSDAVTTMYPLMQPSLEQITKQICQNQSLEQISYPYESRYTSQVLMQTIEKALNKASVK